MRSFIENIRQRGEESFTPAEEPDDGDGDKDKDKNVEDVQSQSQSQSQQYPNVALVENAPINVGNSNSRISRRLNSTVFNALQEQQLDKLEEELKVKWVLLGLLLVLLVCVWGCHIN